MDSFFLSNDNGETNESESSRSDSNRVPFMQMLFWFNRSNKDAAEFLRKYSYIRLSFVAASIIYISLKKRWIILTQ